MISSTETAPHETRQTSFISALKEGHQRFLAHAIEHSFVCGRRTPHDFIRHFPPKAIMKGLEHQPGLRASILVLTTGIKQKIALKKEWEDAATDLQIALDENETDAESIVALFDSDDRVRYLDPQKVWAFLTEGEFWKASATNKGQADLARAHVAFLLERALEDKLVTHRDVVEGATVDELSNRLPKSELGRLIQCALQNADRGTPFTETDLLATTPPRTLVQHVPLGHLWDTVVVPRIADRHGYSPSKPASADSLGTEDSKAAALVEAPRAAAPAEAPKAVSPAEALRAPAGEVPKAARAEAPKAVIAEALKSPVAELPPPAVAKGGLTARDAAPPKDASRVKLKQPEPLAKVAQPDAAQDPGPGVHKAPPTPFGDESDDIEVIEEEVQAV
jgi:hypothetical protein